MQDAKDDLWHDVFWCDKVNVVDPTDILQLDIPFGELFRCEVKAVARMGNVVVLGTRSASILARVLRASHT